MRRLERLFNVYNIFGDGELIVTYFTINLNKELSKNEEKWINW
jgi:hypothetical protein